MQSSAKSNRQYSISLRCLKNQTSPSEIAGLSALDKFNVSVTFLGPWSPQVPIITVVSPHGIKYGSRQGENVIAQKWSQNVSEIFLLFFLSSPLCIIGE